MPLSQFYKICSTHFLENGGKIWQDSPVKVTVEEGTHLGVLKQKAEAGQTILIHAECFVVLPQLLEDLV